MITGETLDKNISTRKFASAYNWILSGTDPVLDKTNTENDSEVKKEGGENKLPRTTEIHKL
jgi:hypothetical protein